MRTTTKLKTVLAASALLIAAPILHGAVVLGGILSPAPGAILYEADNAVIHTFTPAGVEGTFASPSSFFPAGLAFDAAGNLFVADTVFGNIYKFTPAGVQSTFESGLSAPSGLAFDAAGNLYVANGSNVLKITPAGVQTIWEPGLTGVQALAFDAAGNLYVSDTPAGNIYKFSLK